MKDAMIQKESKILSSLSWTKLSQGPVHFAAFCVVLTFTLDATALTMRKNG